MKYSVIYIILSVATLLHGCIAEQRSSECDETLLVRFKYEMNNEYVNQFDAHVDRVVIYIFDDSGKYVTSVLEMGESLANDYIMRIPLPAGLYSLVAYGGDDEMEEYSVGELDSETNTLNTAIINGVTDIEDLHIELSVETGDDGQLYTSDTPTHLFVGVAEGAISAINNQSVTEIDLIKNTNDITVRIVGDDLSEGLYTTSISAENGRYNYQNEVEESHGMVNYQPSSTVMNDGAVENSLRTMRLMIDSPSSTRSVDSTGTITVTSSDSGEILYQESVVDQILGTQQYSTQDDLDREDEYEFEISVESSVVVSVSVNGWQIIDMNPDF